MKSKICLIFIFSLLLVATNSFAYCIYNQTDVLIKAKQVSGGKGLFYRFSKEIDPYEDSKACCNWKNHDCNTEGKRDSIVGFDIYRYSQDIFDHWRIICKNVKIKAGGDLIIKGKKGHYQCIGKDY